MHATAAWVPDVLLQSFSHYTCGGRNKKVKEHCCKWKKILFFFLKIEERMTKRCLFCNLTILLVQLGNVYVVLKVL